TGPGANCPNPRDRARREAIAFSTATPGATCPGTRPAPVTLSSHLDACAVPCEGRRAAPEPREAAMKRVVRDHGGILHGAGRLGAFPVRGADGRVAFAHHGALEGRTPIGWNVFFPALAAARAVVVFDDEAGDVAVVPEADAPRDAAGPAAPASP